MRRDEARGSHWHFVSRRHWPVHTPGREEHAWLVGMTRMPSCGDAGAMDARLGHCHWRGRWALALALKQTLALECPSPRAASEPTTTWIQVDDPRPPCSGRAEALVGTRRTCVVGWDASYALLRTLRHNGCTPRTLALARARKGRVAQALALKQALALECPSPEASTQPTLR